MNRAGRIIFIAGFFIALIAGALVFFTLVMSQPKTADVETTKLVISFQNISPRSEIVAEQVGVADWPKALPTPVGAYGKPDLVVGKLANVPIPPGQAITEKLLLDKKDLKETHSNAALILEKGWVAVAMPVTTKSTVADAIQAGDKVDIIATLKSQSSTAAASNAMATQRLLADVLILQVGPWPGSAATKSSSQGSTASASIITLQLKEQDVLALEYTQQVASSITLVLRPANDRELVTLEPVTFDYINQRFGYRLPR